MRRVHIVGSIPGMGPDDSIPLLVSEFGDSARSIPYERRLNWIIEIIEDRTSHPDLIVLRRSRMSEPRALRVVLDPPRCIPHPGRKVTADTLPLPYSEEASIALPILRSAKSKYGFPGLFYQAGIPDPLNIAGMFWLNPLRHYGAECDAVIREISAIHKMTNGNVIFQLEVPFQTYVTAKSSKFADLLASKICSFISQSPVGSIWIIHLCVGNKNDEPLVVLKDVGPLVDLTDAIYSHWPDGYVFDAVHWPIGSSVDPVPQEPRFYAPARRLTLPTSVHLSAGLVRPSVGFVRHQKALELVISAAGRDDVGVSTPCGGSRQAPESVSTTVELLSMLSRI